MLSVVASAETIPVVPDKEPAVIPYGQTRKFQFGTVSQDKTTVLLKVKSRMDYPAVGGSMHFMKIVVNGRELLPAKSRFLHRLLNKPLASPVQPNLTYSWFDANNGWNVLYAPDFQAAYSQKFYADDPYVYVLDITDLTNPIAENRVEITNTTTLDFIQTNKLANNKLDLVVGSLEIETKPGASPMMSVASDVAPIINRGEPAAGPGKYTGKVLPGGGFSVTMGKDTYNFASAFSFPDAGFNRLAPGAADGSGQKDWKVVQKSNKVFAQSRDYAVARSVTFGSRKVEISDTITNKRAEPLGLSVRHELDITAMKDAPVRLAGNPDAAITEYHSYGNPSVHIAVPQGALGLIIEDQVFRSQAKLYTREDAEIKKTVAGMRTEMLRLAPGESYTMQWSVYPVAGPDFYDFVNLVREDWGANYTAWGTWIWNLNDIAKLPPDEIRARVKRQGIRTFIAPDWVEWTPNKAGTQRIALGEDVFSDYWKARREEYQEDARKIRAAVPDIKILGYYNVMRETTEDTLQRYPDSFQVDEAGNPLTTLWTHSGATNHSYTMVPTLKNSYGKAMLKVAQRYMDDMKFDGIYWDEMEGILFNSILINYNNFDGHSCLLDPKTWRITREVGIVPLSSLSFTDEVIRQTQERKGWLLVNGPTARKSTLKRQVQRMTEIQHNEFYGFEGLLQTPLGYMSWQDGWDYYLRGLKSGLLPAVGFRSDMPHDIAGHLFPFTPIELHSGYLLGKERIVATHNGNYGWKGEPVLALVHHFNTEGKATTSDFTTRIGKEARTAITLQEKEAIVLERLPVRFEPVKPGAGGNAEASQVRYDENGLSLNLNAPTGGILTLSNGTFLVTANATVSVQVGSHPVQRIKAINGVVRVMIPAEFVGKIHIQKAAA